MTKETILQIRDESQATYNKLLTSSNTNTDSLTSVQIMNGSLTALLLCELWLKLEEGMELDKERFDYTKDQDAKQDAIDEERLQRSRRMDKVLYPYMEKADKVADQVLEPPKLYPFSDPPYQVVHKADCASRNGLLCDCGAIVPPAKPNA